MGGLKFVPVIWFCVLGVGVCVYFILLIFNSTCNWQFRFRIVQFRISPSPCILLGAGIEWVGGCDWKLGVGICAYTNRTQG